MLLALATSAVDSDACPEGQAPAFAGSTTCLVDPLSIPKYVTPLVIPPVMNNDGESDSYDIAVRQFRQQILPGGIWNTINGRNDMFPATTVWSYGPAEDAVPPVAPDPGSQFNYPAYTLETTSDVPVSVRWINDLVDEDGNCLEHLLPIDQTLHWANPPMDCRMGPARTDCSGDDPEPYTGPVPIVTHVHGAHVDGHSDGYPEAWWLPACDDIPDGYATSGTIFGDATGSNDGGQGYADYYYRQDQPAATLWYHDHSLGMTRSNVYAGPAGFWLVRGGEYDSVLDVRKGRPATLPGPAPVEGQTVLELNVPGDPVRDSIREIPIAIQDRSFLPDGSLFYPDNRAHFEELNPEQLQIAFVPDSDIAPIWNPEAFFNTMVVNGVSWPVLEVAPARYRFRLLNGCNSRFLNLALRYVEDDDSDESDDDPHVTGRVFGDQRAGTSPSLQTSNDPDRRVENRPQTDGDRDGMGGRIEHFDGDSDDEDGDGPVFRELPFIQIGAEQGFLPTPVEILTGFATPLTDPRGKRPKWDDRVPAPDPQQALLMTLAERADVIVDFSDLPHGTIVTMINTAPDAPFGGFPDDPADPDTTGQVMRFVVNHEMWLPSDEETTKPYRLRPVAEPALDEPIAAIRDLSLNEGESEEVCVVMDDMGNIVQVPGEHPPCTVGEAFAPKEALLGVVDENGEGVPLKWTDTTGVSQPAMVTLASGEEIWIHVTENPTAGDSEEWELYNFTEDAHPIHLHLVRFEVVGRRGLDGGPSSVGNAPQPWESGYKDTVIAYPGEITTVRARFDIPGLYVWHCHIVEHEDNEMMRPFVVSP
jgi:FtsP/CotA-like multicopper oxidase with cupredoxin domain